MYLASSLQIEFTQNSFICRHLYKNCMTGGGLGGCDGLAGDLGGGLGVASGWLWGGLEEALGGGLGGGLGEGGAGILIMVYIIYAAQWLDLTDMTDNNRQLVKVCLQMAW